MAKTKSRAPARQTNLGAILTIGVIALIVLGIGAQFILPKLQSQSNQAIVFNTPAPALPQSNVAQPANPNAPRTPDFSTQTIDGQTVSLAQERGRMLGIFFMASWCSSCAGEANAWGQLYAKYHDKGLDVLIVDVDQTETKNDLLAFKKRWGGGDHYWALDTNGALVKTFRVQSLDTTYLIDREGRVVYYDYWATPLDVLEREVLKVLQ